jgi:hypothetical protein
VRDGPRGVLAPAGPSTSEGRGKAELRNAKRMRRFGSGEVRRLDFLLRAGTGASMSNGGRGRTQPDELHERLRAEQPEVGSGLARRHATCGICPTCFAEVNQGVTMTPSNLELVSSPANSDLGRGRGHPLPTAVAFGQPQRPSSGASPVRSDLAERLVGADDADASSGVRI